MSSSSTVGQSANPQSSPQAGPTGQAAQSGHAAQTDDVVFSPSGSPPATDAGANGHRPPSGRSRPAATATATTATGADNEGSNPSGPPAGGGGTFASFRSPGYPILWWGSLFSFLSVQMQMLLRGLLAWDLTESEAALGLVYLAFGVSMLVSTPLGGVATDILPKKRLLVISQGVISVVAASMGVVVVTGIAQFWMLVLSAAFQGAAFGFLGPARIAISRELVGREYLGNAITLSLLSMNGTRVFAPSLAGVLAGVAAIGIGGTYLIAAAAAVVSWIFVLRLPSSPQVANHESNQNGVAAPTAKRWKNPFSEIIDGLQYVMANRSLRHLVPSSFFVVMFGFSYVAFLPALVEGQYELSEAWVGLMSSASAVGAVVSAVLLAKRADSPYANRLMILSGVTFGIGVMMFGQAPGFWSAFAVVIFIGAAFTVYQSLSNTIALAIADDAHQGRVQSLMMLSFAGFGIAAAPMGALAELIGLRDTITLMGAIALVASAVYGATHWRGSAHLAGH